jgi:hypothetical protein
MNQEKYLRDVEFGLENEKKYLPILQEKFGTLKDLGRYATLDFEGDDCFVELKTMKVSMKGYKYAIIGKNKIDKAKIVNKKVFFVFVYNEGNFCYEFDKSIDLYTKKTGRRDRGVYEEKDYCFIPITSLEKF